MPPAVKKKPVLKHGPERVLQLAGFKPAPMRAEVKRHKAGKSWLGRGKIPMEIDYGEGWNGVVNESLSPNERCEHLLAAIQRQDVRVKEYILSTLDGHVRQSAWTVCVLLVAEEARNLFYSVPDRELLADRLLTTVDTLSNRADIDSKLQFRAFAAAFRLFGLTAPTGHADRLTKYIRKDDVRSCQLVFTAIKTLFSVEPPQAEEAGQLQKTVLNFVKEQLRIDNRSNAHVVALSGAVESLASLAVAEAPKLLEANATKIQPDEAAFMADHLTELSKRWRACGGDKQEWHSNAVKSNRTELLQGCLAALEKRRSVTA